MTGSRFNDSPTPTLPRVRGREWEGAAPYQAGFSLVAAIFLLVVLAAIGVFIVTIGGVQRHTVVLAAQSTRAYQAARAGVEWVGVNVAGPSATVATRATACGGAVATPATNSFTLNATGIGGFSVSATCSYTTHQENGSTFNVYSVTSTATSGAWGQPDFVQRRVLATLTDLASP